jgi:hypothetical protein
MYCGETDGKIICDRVPRAYCLSRVDHVQTIRDRKQRTDVRKYSLVNGNLKPGSNFLQKR